MTNSLEITVEHNPQARRFEVKKDGHLAVLKYQLVDRKIIFTHAIVPEAIGRQGVGSRLAVTGLDYARAQSLAVVPLCSFMVWYIQKHPEYQDLVK
jgi:predicted GNAT family acetyltransferase